MELQSSNWLLHFLTGQEDIVEYLKKIEPGRIVLLASYDDVAPKWVLFWEKAIYISHNPSLFFFQCLKSFGRMTDEMRDILAGMGSTLIKTVKSKDSWVFAGRAATGEKSLFEKVSDHVDCNSLCSFRGQWKPFILIYSSESKKKKKKSLMENRCLFLCQMAVNDPKTNAYDGWPEVVEINGCLPRKSGLTDTKP